MLRALALLVLFAGCDFTLDFSESTSPVPRSRSILVPGVGPVPATAQPYAGDPALVVISAYVPERRRTLMLTFDRVEGRVSVKRELTGFWDLSRCVPRRAFRLLDTGQARVRVDRIDGARITGNYDLILTSDDDPSQRLEVTNAWFNVEVVDEPFAFCSDR